MGVSDLNDHRYEFRFNRFDQIVTRCFLWFGFGPSFWFRHSDNIYSCYSWVQKLLPVKVEVEEFHVGFGEDSGSHFLWYSDWYRQGVCQCFFPLWSLHFWLILYFVSLFHIKVQIFIIIQSKSLIILELAV